jgi:hypothetical protein
MHFVRKTWNVLQVIEGIEAHSPGHMIRLKRGDKTKVFQITMSYMEIEPMGSSMSTPQPKISTPSYVSSENFSKRKNSEIAALRL